MSLLKNLIKEFPWKHFQQKYLSQSKVSKCLCKHRIIQDVIDRLDRCFVYFKAPLQK